MIPTHSKSKLPKTLSYPLGAQAISEALSDAPHVEAFTLSFSDTPVWPASDFQKRLREGLPYPVLVAEFSPSRRPGFGGMQTLVEGGFYDAHWSLRVYPVSREVKHAVGELLRDQGLPAVTAWLKASNKAGWDSRQHTIKLVFCSAEGTLTVQQEDGV